MSERLVTIASSSVQEMGLARSSSCCFSSRNLSWNLFFSLMAGLPSVGGDDCLAGLKHFSAGRGVLGRGWSLSQLPGRAVRPARSNEKGRSKSRLAALSTLQFLDGVISPSVFLMPLMGELSSKLRLSDLTGDRGVVVTVSRYGLNPGVEEVVTTELTGSESLFCEAALMRAWLNDWCAVRVLLSISDLLTLGLGGEGMFS